MVVAVSGALWSTGKIVSGAFAPDLDLETESCIQKQALNLLCLSVIRLHSLSRHTFTSSPLSIARGRGTLRCFRVVFGACVEAEARGGLSLTRA